jgi:hypothetical protein
MLRFQQTRPVAFTFILPVIFILFSLSSAAYGEWTEILKSIKGDAYYLDPDRIETVSENVYRAWTKSEPREPGLFEGNYITKSTTLYEFDCYSGRHRVLQTAFYFTNGETHSEIAETPEWKEISPGTVTEFMQKVVCIVKSEEIKKDNPEL